ncbi:hypothetical protein C8F01DRAFT_989075 [Mycena amicta]|nr:hypothetical protein C8F01DRAFT_989075 [Mycena amicta]
MHVSRKKRKKGAKDPPRTHPQTHFVPEEYTAATEEYVDGVRSTKPKAKKRRVTVTEEEDDYVEPGLKLPRSVLDHCEASFKAADEKRQKASSTCFDDTGLMALTCRHDVVLFMANMHSAGEKQFYVISLLEMLFQHLQISAKVGTLYDVACAFERACKKWGFLQRYEDRLSFAVSVFHAFGHEWACQLLYSPRKRIGFAFSDGEGCERVWNSLSHLVASMRITGYHNRLYTLDRQLTYNKDASLQRLGEWILRRHRHCTNQRAAAEKDLRVAQDACHKSVEELREQFSLQVQAQTRPIQRRSKKLGEKAVEHVLQLRTAVKAGEAELAALRRTLTVAVNKDDDENLDALMLQVTEAQESLDKTQLKLQRKERALGVPGQKLLKKISRSEYLSLRMNARALKTRLRDRLRSRKFELDRVERSFRRLVNEQKLYSHTESAVKRREPTIRNLNKQYNEMCAKIVTTIKSDAQLRDMVPPRPIEPGKLWTLDVDDEIWEDIGLDDEEFGDVVPDWLGNEGVRLGIRAMLVLDRCDEEDVRLKKERIALQVWFAEEWQLIILALGKEGVQILLLISACLNTSAEDSSNRYQLEQ